MSRTLDLAIRCQRLTGSYDEATRSCSCSNLKDCLLSRIDLEKYGNHDKVLEAKHRNLGEFCTITRGGSI